MGGIRRDRERMRREYHKWFSPTLSREMELLVFGHAGTPALVFPTSCGRFYDFEDQGMVAAVAPRIEAGSLQLICVDSVDAESWYNRRVAPRWRIVRHLQYEAYLLEELLPFVRGFNPSSTLAVAGCSFGGFHAVNLALRHPALVSSLLSISGIFDPSPFLDGYHDRDTYLNVPLHYLPNLAEPWFLDRLRANRFVLATGVHDQCWSQNEALARVMEAKNIPVRLEVWGDGAGHDWSWWRKMAAEYL